jgi:excisionase family DNA binding protein
MMNSSDKFLSASEVANALGVCRDTVYRMVREGSIRGVRVRGQWRIATSELNKYINTNTVIQQ